MIDNCFFLELASVHMHKAGKRREVGAMFGARVVIYKPSVKIYFPATSRTGIVSVSESCAPSGQGIISSPAAWSEYLGVFLPPLPRPGLNSSPAHVSFAGQYPLIKLGELRVCVFTVFSTKKQLNDPAQHSDPIWGPLPGTSGCFPVHTVDLWLVVPNL